MATAPSKRPIVKQLFINLPVKDLKRTIAFFTKLGFAFDPEFTDEKATCMIIGKDIYAMLLVERFFKTFTKKRLIETKRTAAAIYSLSVDSKAAVDAVIKNAIKAGGKEPNPKIDTGWMYNRSFEDIDGHIWEVFYMDLKAMRKANRQSNR